MSDIITGTEYNDPRLQTIRTQVSAKNDNVPFLLLPVKVETRFMSVDRPLYDVDVFPDVLTGLFELEDRIRFRPEVLPPHEVLGKLRKIRDQFDDIGKKTSEIKRLSPDDKEYLRTKLSGVESAHQKLSLSLSQVNWQDPEKMRELRSLKNEMAKNLQAGASVIRELQPAEQPDLSESTSFLSTVEEINETLHAINRKKMSLRDRKEKRLIFQFLDAQLAKIDQAVKTARRDIRTSMIATEAQLEQLDVLKQELEGLFAKTETNIQKIKSDYKKLEYNEKLALVTKAVTRLHEEIDTRLRPKVEMKRNLKTVNARVVLWQINKIRFRLKELNQHPFKTYEEVRNTREGLYADLHALRADVHKIVEGSEEDLKALSFGWDDADRELEKFTQRVKTFKGVGREKAGLKRTVTHINEEYRKDLAGLKSSSKSYFTQLNNDRLEKSAVSFNQSITTLTAVKKEIEKNIKDPSSQKFQEAVLKLEAFRETFSVSARDIHVLPEKEFMALTELSSQLEAVISKAGLNTRSKKIISAMKTASEAAASIKSIADAQYSDAINRKDRFYDELRNPFVFSRKTITRDELWVRFYPDDIAIHTHEEALTQEEVDAGKAYWFEIWAANDDYQTKLAAWRAISTSYGSQRAAWIVKTLEPKSPGTTLLKDKLRSFSSGITEINAKLENIVKSMDGGTDLNDLIPGLGRVYPLVNEVERSISSIKEGHANQLLKTQGLLLKVQSKINSAIRTVNATPLSGRSNINEQAEVVQQFGYAFNRTVRSFQKIEKRTAKDLYKGEEAKVFPEVAIKSGSWTVAPHAQVMPDRFVVITMRNGTFKHVVAGEPLPADKLIVGLDPATFDTGTFQYDAEGNLVVDESIKWLTDFDEAKKKGMAVSIVLDDEDLAGGFDKVLVLGVKGSTALQGKDLLEKLLENHHYIPEGASFLPVNTPTNNTESGTSGYRSFETDAVLSFAVERNNEEPVPASSPGFPTDSARLAEGLGIDPDILNNLDFHNRTEISEALIMNKALFHGTIGSYMEEGLDTLFTLDNVRHTKTFFTNYVTARGFLPSLRVGTQPYGILPTTAFSKFHATADDSFLPELNKADFENPSAISHELQARYDIRLKQLLSAIDSLWTGIRNSKVPHAGNTDPADPQAHFMKMLGLHANSAEYFYRYGLNVASRRSVDEAASFNISFNSTDPWSPTKVAETFRDLIFSGYYFNSDNFADEQTTFSNIITFLNSKYSRISDQFVKARVFATRHLKDQAQVLGNIVDNRALADELVAATNPNAGSAEDRAGARAELAYFIDWLVNNNAWDVHAENKFSEASGSTLTAGMPSKSLLFLLLRHSILTAHADTILKILEYEGLTDQKTRKKMGQAGYYHTRFADGFKYVTKWTYLFSKIPSLDKVLGFEMDHSNGFYNYMSSLSGSGSGYLNRYLSPEHPYVFNNYPNHHQHQVFVDELNATRGAMLKLKDIPTARLQQLLAEHIDLCTYRLDAWRLGMVNKRLKEQRATTASGIYLGAYGWVENLKKGGARTLAANIPDGLWKSGDEPVYTDADSLGFIHTPSLNHAITAAILRAGFDANADTAEVNNQMAVNLSSGRVRMALNLLNGIRGGQDAAALLGYQFERGLHERYLHIPLELDEYIYDFREEFPLAVPVNDDLSLGESTLNNVVNGMELLETAQEFVESQGGPPNPTDSLYQSLKAYETAWWAHIANQNISAASAAKRDAMLREIDRMADAFDAFGDLCISESVYQVARGNHVRASAIMDKLAKGDVPSDIEIADTPRTGTVVTHKVGMFFDVVSGIDHALTETGEDATPLEGSALDAAVALANAAPAGWSSTFTPRALAEPTLNKWAGEMIGNPANIRCYVAYTIGAINDTTTVTLADLEVQPLDALHLFGTGPLDGGAELNARIAQKVKSSMPVPAGFEGNADDAVINIRYTFRDESWAAHVYSFYEKAGFIQSLRALLTSGAVLAADSLLIPGEQVLEENEVRNQDVDEYAIRITNLHARLQALQEEWSAFFTGEVSLDTSEAHAFTGTQIDTMRTLLFRSAAFGIPGTIPDRIVSNDNTTGLMLLNAADGASKAIADRLKQVIPDMAVVNDGTKSNDIRISAVQEAGRKLLGKAFVMIPHFNLRNGADLQAQLTLDADKGLLRAAGTQAMEKWSTGVARVRERMAGWETLQMWMENFDVAQSEWKPLQFPFALDADGKSTDHWLGIEFPVTYQPQEDKLSIVLMNAAVIATAPDTPKAAMLIDEWVEIIPNLNETTGITFNYDQPDAKAPNNLLLAVTPKQTGHWQWDDLVYTLIDTMEMAKNRAVEPEQLEDTVFGQILPGMMTEIVPPELLPDESENSGDAQDNPLGLQVVTDFGVVNDTYVAEPEE